MKAMPKEKILKIIEREGHITVKLDNYPLMSRLEAMEKKGLVELAHVRTYHHYYKAKGSDWEFPKKWYEEE